jgi:hypothetical protein
MPSKSAPFVCQHMEGISRQVLEKYQRAIRSYVRRRHGIYALYRKNRLYYVGLASNLRVRLNHHLRDRHAKTWDRFSVYLTIGDRYLRELEALVLRIASPRGNKVRGKLGKSEDLRRRFRRDIARLHREELAELFPLSRGEADEGPEPPAVRSKVSLAPYVTKPFPVRWRYKGKIHKAHVRRDGMIRLNGKLYRSPSGAAHAIYRGAIDGWHAWKYERAPGDWVALNELRR